MKNLKLLLLALFSIGLIATSCKKDKDEIPPIDKKHEVKSIVDDKLGTIGTFNYDSENRVNNAIIKFQVQEDHLPPMTAEAVFDLKYKSGDQIDYLTITIMGVKDSLVFDYTNETITFVAWQKSPTEKYAIGRKNIIELNADKTYKSNMIYDFDGSDYVLSSSYIFTWENNNLTKVIEKDVQDMPNVVVETTSLYIYDDKPNPFKNFTFLAFFSSSYFELSANNIIKEVDMTDGQTDVTTFSLTYNADDYPETIETNYSDGTKDNIKIIYR